MSKPTDPAELRQWLDANGPLACPRCNSDAVQVELLDTDTQPHEVFKCKACGHKADFLHPRFGTKMDYAENLSFQLERHSFLAPWQKTRTD